MELGSGSLNESGGGGSGGGGSSSPLNSSTESLSSSSPLINGLKFGQKIYFEDVGTSGAPIRASGSGSGRRARGAGGGGSGGMVPSGQPPRCQVEGCKVDLSDAKAYYSRHKVCGMHSKSPVVIVAGLEQRFCQQCSRFHQLPEFDQGKRSCRRRLAGHNERRRKPPPGSLLATRYGRLSSPVIVTENSSTGGGFLLDFSAYQRAAVSDGWPMTRVSERVPGNQTTFTARHLECPPWHHSENPPPDLYLQCSTGRTGFSGPGFPSGECFTGVADSSCALSLLSNQPWGSRNRASGLGVGNWMHAESKSASPHGTDVNQYPNMSWGFKGNEAGSSSHQMPPELGLGPSSEPVNGQFPGGLELSQQSSKHYLELENSRDYNDSTQQMHWSL